MSSQDPREYLNDAEEAQRLSLEGWQSRMWTAMPCIVTSVNLAKMTLVCQLALQGRMEDQNGVLSFVNVQPIQDVPIVFPSAGGFTITFPIAAGDEVLVLFASRCIDSWWQNGGHANVPMEFRMHDLSDGFAIPGPRSQPRVIAGISATDCQIRNDAGNAYVSVTADGKIKLHASEVDVAGDLKVTGAITATGEITAHTSGTGIPVSTHKHTGVTTGAGTSGGPTP